MYLALFLTFCFILLMGIGDYELNIPFFSIINDFVYKSLESTIKGNVGNSFSGKLILTSSFIIMLIGNIVGNFVHSFNFIPYVPIILSFIALFWILATKIRHEGFGVFHLFLPRGVPILISPLIFFIELFTFLVKPLILTIRIMISVMVGHMVLESIIQSSSSIPAGAKIFFYLIPVLISIIEFLISLLQAFLFTTFLAIYMNSALESH
jgi:F-type H+-transporting ATPase subunit a